MQKYEIAYLQFTNSLPLIRQSWQKISIIAPFFGSMCRYC